MKFKSVQRQLHRRLSPVHVASRRAAIAFLLVAMWACEDKILLPDRALSPRIAFRFAAQVATGGRAVDVHVGYDRTNGTRVTLFDRRVDVTPGDQSVAVALDLTTCLDDGAHSGDADTCQLRLSVALHDSVDIAIDSVEVGPFDAQRGRAPNVPTVGLGLARFAVHQWVADRALTLGGANNPLDIAAMSGYVNAAGAAVPVTLSNFNNSTLGVPASRITAFENGAWRVVALLNGTTLSDIAALSATDMWMSGQNGLYHYDGVTISAVSAVTDSLVTIAARTVGSARLIVAGGGGGNLWTGDGTTWQRHIVSFERFQAACVSSATEAFVGTRQGNVYRFNGAAWTITPTPFPAPKVLVECTQPGTAFTADTLSLLRWNVSSWGGWSSPYPGQGVLIGFGTGATDEAYAVGRLPGSTSAFETSFSRFNGVAWQEIGRIPFANSPLGSSPIWADPRGGRAFVAYDEYGRIQQLEGNTVSLLSYEPYVRDVVVTSPTNAVVVGWNTFLARWNGTKWTIDPPPAALPRRVALLYGVWSDGPSNAWAVGSSSVVLHWNGTTWNVVFGQNSSQFVALNSVWGQGNTVIIAGREMLRCTGEQCVVEVAPNGTAEMLSVWGSSPQNVFAVGQQGVIMHNDGQIWTQMQSPTTHTLRRVWGSGPSDVWAFGDSVLVRYNGSSWQDVPMVGDLELAKIPQSGSPNLRHNGLWGSGPKDVYVGSTNGRIVRFDGTTWRVMQTATTRRIIAISGTASTGAIALGDPRNLCSCPVLLRGVTATGGMGQAMGAPTVWY